MEINESNRRGEEEKGRGSEDSPGNSCAGTRKCTVLLLWVNDLRRNVQCSIDTDDWTSSGGGEGRRGEERSRREEGRGKVNTNLKSCQQENTRSSMISEEASSHYTHSRGSHTHTVNYLYKTALSAPKTPTNKSKRQKQTSARPLIPVEGGVKMGLGLTLCV